jgi:hypothetical protein
MQFQHLEPGATVTDAIPSDAGYQTLYMPRQTRWAIQPTQGCLSDTGSQKPDKTGNVINMGMADENIAQLMGNPGRQP